MTDIAFVAIVLLSSAVLVVTLAARASVVFTLHVERGRVKRVRGRLSPTLLHDLQAVLGRAQSSGQIRVRRSRGTAVLEADSGFDAGTLQQLRNVIGNVPLQRLVTAPAMRRDGVR